MEGPSIRRWSRGGALLTAGLLAVAVALPAAAQDGVTKLGYVSPEPAADYGWNEQGAIAAEAVATAIGAEYVQQDGVGYGPEEVAPILNQFAEEGVDFIVAQASGYNEVAPTFAAENKHPGPRRRQPRRPRRGPRGELRHRRGRRWLPGWRPGREHDPDRHARHRPVGVR